MFCPPSLLKASDSEAITPRLSLSPSLFALLLHPVSPSFLSLSLLSGRITAAGGMCVRLAAARWPVGLKKSFLWGRRDTKRDERRPEIQNGADNQPNGRIWDEELELQSLDICLLPWGRHVVCYRFLFVRQAQAYLGFVQTIEHLNHDRLIVRKPAETHDL